MEQHPKKKSLTRRIVRIILKTFLFLFLFILLLFTLILLPPVQHLIKKKAIAYLENKLHTKIEIGSIYLTFPKKIVIEDFYIQDRKQDTLAWGHSLKVNIGLWRLIFRGEMEIDKIELSNSTVKIHRSLPDTIFNYQFIIDAFSPAATAVKKDTVTDSSPISINTIRLDKIRLVFRDALTGNDAEASLDHLDVHIDKIDPDHLLYVIPEANIEGLTARIYQYKPLAKSEPLTKDMNGALAPMPLQLVLDKISLQRIHIDYRNDIAALYSQVNIADAKVKVNALDPGKRMLSLSDLSLENSDVAVRLGKKEMAKVVVKETKQEIQSQSVAGWRIEVASVKLDNNSISFEDENMPRQAAGMDYAHLQANSLFLHIDDLLFSGDSIAGRITKGSVKERSGFTLQQLETKFFYGSTGGYLKDLHLKTPGTELKRDIVISYPSLAAIENNPGIIEINADIADSKIGVKDILVFAPGLRQQPAFANSGAGWYLNGRVTGHVNKLDIKKLQFRGLSGTSIDIKGMIAGLPVIEKVKADLVVNNFTSNRNDIDLFLPPGTLPDYITWPANLHAAGRINGDIAGMRTDLVLQTNLGDATIKGLFKQYADPQQISYDAAVQTKSLNLGVILQQEQTIGLVSASFGITGTGTDPKTANAIIEGKVQSVLLNGYDYRNLRLKGRIADQKGKLEAAMMEPNIHFAMNATADLSKDYPALVIHATIDSLKAQALHLTPNMVIYRGNIDADIPVTDPDKPEGKILLTRTLVVNEGKRVQLDTVQMLAGTDDKGNYIRLISAAATAGLTGKYQLMELGTIFQDAVQPYFAIMPAASRAIKLKPYDFNLDATIVNSPLLSVFVPGLKKIEPVSIRSHFDNTNGWNASLVAPFIDIGGSIARNLNITASTLQNEIDLKATLDQLSSGSLALTNATVTASIADNKIDFLFNSKDGAAKDKYNFAGILRQAAAGNYSLSLKPAGLVLNYEAWTIGANNELLIRHNDINARDFVLQKNGQSFTLASVSPNINSALEASFSNFKLATLTGFIQADGEMNGKLLFTNLTTNPVFTGDLTINDLAIQKDTVGNVKILMNNRIPGVYNADVTLTGRGNDVRLTGNYYPDAVNSNQFDFAVDIVALPLTTAQAFSEGAITEASGLVNGKFTIRGRMNDPSVTGDLNFNKTGFNLKMLNSYFTIDHEKIRVSEEGFAFNDFAVRDSAGNTLSVNGTAATHNFTNYQFDMTVRANNFRALNSTKTDNRYFYGQLYFNTNMRITGTETAPVIDGRLTVNEKTRMTIVLPQEEPGVVEREGVVEFVDISAGINDSLFGSALDSLNTIGFTGMDISMNLQLDKAADITFVIDEGNGDFLNLKGEASITADIDRTGKIFMSGSYELDQGVYEISFNLLRRRFVIQKGSRITWQGEPTRADVNITAIYTVNTAPLDLVKNQLSEGISTNQRNTYLQKLPFEVTLRMTGELIKPEISFDIKLPENKSFQVSNDIITNVKTRLDQLRQEEGEMNKQVFSLLLLNRFVAENPFASSTGYASVSTLAKQSVSKLLTEQLNRLATDLVKGVELNFDVQASEDYTTGSRQDRTDLNVGISKRLMNDRLTVTVGSNFELEGPQNSNQQSNNIAGNVALDYKLSKDGRYLLRAYRKNDYQGVIDGYVIETGVGFIITVDYNRFRELFHARRSRQKSPINNNDPQKNETPPVAEKLPVKE